MQAVMIAMWFVVATWLNPSVAHAQASYFYIEDTSNQMAAKDIASQPFTALEDSVINFGFTQSTYWVKVLITPHVDKTLYLSIIPANLIKIQAFRLNGTNWEAIKQDNPTLTTESIYYKKNEIFPVYANIDSETLLLKINTKSTVFAVFNLDSEGALFNKLMALTGDLNFYLGVALSFALVLIIFGLYQKDLFMLATLLWTIQFVLYRISLAGASLVDTQILGLTDSQTLSGVLLPITICLYLVALLHTHHIHGLTEKLSLGLTAVVLTLALFFFFSEDIVYLKWSAYWSFLPVILLISTACTPSSFRQLGMTLSISIFILGVSILLFRLTQLGLLPSMFNALLAPSLHIPFFILLSGAAFSKVKKNQQLKEITQQYFLAKANRETETIKLQKEQQHKFLLMLTHELKNSLSVLRIYLQMPQTQELFSSFAEQSIVDMDTIIERCAQIDQLEREEIKLHYASVDLNELIKQILNKNTFKDRLIFDNQCTNTVIKTDLTLMRTIINNLIDNALKYSVPETHIILTIRNTSEERSSKNMIHGLTFSINNEVVPQNLPDQSLIFTKYYRGNMSNRLTGSGLGLYIVQALAKMLKGDLTYSHHDNDVTFKLWLPI